MATRTRPVSDEALRAERARILTSLLSRLDDLSEAGLEAIFTEIPAYGARRNEQFYRDVGEQVRLHYSMILSSLLEERTVSIDDIVFMRPAAMRRARTGFALEDFISAFRVALQALWDAVVETAGDSTQGRDAALILATPLMRYIDFVSTQAGHAYVEFQQALLADADRERRDLLELLLTGELTGDGLAAARAYGIGRDERMLIVAAASTDPHVSGDAVHAASSAIARATISVTQTLVVVRHSEIVAVPVLRPGEDPARLCERLEALQERLSREVTPLAVGISMVAHGAAELPRAYRDARAALESLSGPGVAALPRLRPLDYLILHSDDTAHRLVDERLRAFIEGDRARGSVLSATLEAFADADLNLRLAAKRLHVHSNTAQYRLRRVEERTGRNPRRIADLLDLLVAIRLEG